MCGFGIRGIASTLHPTCAVGQCAFSLLPAHKFPVSLSLTQLPWSPQEPTSGKMWCSPVIPFVLNGLPGTWN